MKLGDYVELQKNINANVNYKKGDLFKIYDRTPDYFKLHVIDIESGEEEHRGILVPNNVMNKNFEVVMQKNLPDTVFQDATAKSEIVKKGVLLETQEEMFIDNTKVKLGTRGVILRGGEQPKIKLIVAGNEKIILSVPSVVASSFKIAEPVAEAEINKMSVRSKKTNSGELKLVLDYEGRKSIVVTESKKGEEHDVEFLSNRAEKAYNKILERTFKNLNETENPKMLHQFFLEDNKGLWRFKDYVKRELKSKAEVETPKTKPKKRKIR